MWQLETVVLITHECSVKYFNCETIESFAVRSAFVIRYILTEPQSKYLTMAGETHNSSDVETRRKVILLENDSVSISIFENLINI